MDSKPQFPALLVSTLTFATVLACQLFSPSTPAPPTVEPSVPTPTLAEEPAAEPTENPVEPVTIRLVRSGDERIPAGVPVQLTVGWVAVTEEQVADFLAAISLTGTLDGEPLSGLNDYWGEIGPYEGGAAVSGELHVSEWLYPLGVLDPGEHTVEILGTLQQSVTDGYDSNNDGQPDQYSGEVFHFTVRIVVEE
jgi:hypothetical protein